MCNVVRSGSFPRVVTGCGSGGSLVGGVYLTLESLDFLLHVFLQRRLFILDIPEFTVCSTRLVINQVEFLVSARRIAWGG